MRHVYAHGIPAQINPRQHAPLLDSTGPSTWAVERGGPIVLTCNALRAFSCLLLFALSATANARRTLHATGPQDMLNLLALVGMPAVFVSPTLLCYEFIASLSFEALHVRSSRSSGSAPCTTERGHRAALERCAFL